jgi:hypothetical protein
VIASGWSLWLRLPPGPAKLEGLGGASMNSRWRRRRLLLWALAGLGAVAAPRARAQAFDPLRLLKGVGERGRRQLEQSAAEALRRSLFPPDPAASRFLREMPEFDAVAFGPFASMQRLQRSPGGGFQIVPGAWQIELQSYCLRFGTYERTGGEGYRVGVVAGGMASTVQALLQAAYGHPEVPQQHIQQLIWGLLAGVPPSRMAAPALAAARSLLSPTQLLAAEGAGSDLPARISAKALAQLPPELRQLAEVAERLRAAAMGGASYAQLEAIAVLQGTPPPQRQPIPADRWSAHPDGYLMRIRSDTYRRTTVQIVRAEPLRIERDARGRISRLRLSDGSGLTLTYRDKLGPLRHRAYPGLAIWCFATIQHTAADGRSGPVLRNRGWTLVHERQRRASGSSPLLASLASDLPGPLAQASTLEVDPNLNALEGLDEDLQSAAIGQIVEASGSGTLRRIHAANERAEAYEELLDPEHSDAVNDLLDASNVREGVVTVTVGDTAERLGFIAETHARLARALARVTELFERELPAQSGAPTWEPPSTTGAPGAMRQIRGLSARS